MSSSASQATTAGQTASPPQTASGRSATDSDGDTWGVAQRVTSTRLIGRRQELGELEEALEDATAGRPRLVFIAGESGVGKSRLLRALLDAAEERGARTLGGACFELGQDELPYAPLVATLRPLHRSEDPVLSRLSEVTRGELARLIPELGEPSEESEVARGEAQRRLFDAFLELIAMLTDEQPVVLWIDDIHWADRSTRAFLRFLEASMSEERVLVATTYRSDELHRRHPLRPLLAELERSQCARRIELDRFDREEVAEQLADILGHSPNGDVVERMYGRSEGNPLFTEELLAAGLDARGPLPPSLREALLLRIERLSEQAQTLLRLLAVASRADGELLAVAAGVDAGAVVAAIREAIAAQIAVTDDAGRFGLRHALLREVLYDDLLPGERTELHLALAEALERRAASDGGAWIATGIAHHYDAAGEQPRALVAKVNAAAAVQRLHAYGEATELLDRALELWHRIPDAEELSGIDHAELLARAGRAHFLTADDERAAALYEHAIEEVDPGEDPERAANLLWALAGCQWSLGQAERSRETQRRGLELLSAEEESAARARLLAQRVRFLLLQGRFRDVREESPAALEASRRLGLDSSTAGILSRLGSALYALGETEEGRARSLEAIDVARRSGSTDDIATAILNYADALHNAGLTREGREIAVDGIKEIDEIVGSTAIRSLRWTRLNLAEIEFALGNWDAAAQEIRAGGAPPGGVVGAHALLRSAELALGRGDAAQARTDLEHAAELLSGVLEPQYIAVLADLSADLERRSGDLDAARAAIDRGIDRIQYCSDDATRIAQVAVAGVAVEADAAERARDVGGGEAEENAIARAEMLTEMVRAAAEEGGRPVEAAYVGRAEAELARAEGHDDPELWAESAAAWDAIDRPYTRAVAHWREAQASLAAGDRDRAARAAAEALETARELGSAWLEGEAEGLAARGRLRLAVGAAEAEEVSEEEPEPFGLTPRERQVLALLASGATNREIAEELYMAEKTASVHVSRILTKLDVRSRTEAAAVAHRHGLAAPVGAAGDG
jgi:ATP/maltotriose-dependent transcriptional regulator MalT